VEDNVNNNDDQPWWRKGTLPYTLACTLKSRPSPTPILTTERKRKRKKPVLALAGLSS
jgi:hypothetical protein